MYSNFFTLNAAAWTKVYEGMAAVCSGLGEADKSLEFFQKSLDLNDNVEDAELQQAVGALNPQRPLGLVST